MKLNLPKIILIISLIPYALILLCALFSAIGGHGINLLDGFLFGGAIALIAMWRIMIIPVCLIYQTAYVLYYTVGLFEKVNTIKFFVTVGIIIAAVFAAVFAAKYFVPAVSNAEKERQSAILHAQNREKALQSLENADEKIIWGDISRDDGFFEIEEVTKSVLLIDYDSCEVSWITKFRNQPEDVYHSVKLTETEYDSEIISSICDAYNVQADFPLSSPGKRLIAFSVNSNYSERQFTVAVILEKSDGTVYYADKIGSPGSVWDSKYSGFGISEYYPGKDVKISGLRDDKDD